MICSSRGLACHSQCELHIGDASTGVRNDGLAAVIRVAFDVEAQPGRQGDNLARPLGAGSLALGSAQPPIELDALPDQHPLVGGDRYQTGRNTDTDVLSAQRESRTDRLSIRAHEPRRARPVRWSRHRRPLGWGAKLRLALTCAILWSLVQRQFATDQLFGRELFQQNVVMARDHNEAFVIHDLLYPGQLEH
jgi:hypothetical protein